MHITETKIEVRYAETDQMGVVHHSNYIIWFEIGRTQLMKDLGFSYAKLEERGILSPVIEISASYKRPTRYGETVTIKCWIERYDGLRTTYRYEILNEQGELCVEGESTHVCVKKGSFRPISMRKHLPDWHDVYEKMKRHA